MKPTLGKIEGAQLAALSVSVLAMLGIEMTDAHLAVVFAASQLVQAVLTLWVTNSLRRQNGSNDPGENRP